MNAVPQDGEILEGNARYIGYSMDLIAAIARIIGFQFQFRMTDDNKNGNWDEKTKRWTGVIGDLLERVLHFFKDPCIISTIPIFFNFFQRAHLGICDLTITHERREVVDFSMPFMNLGMSSTILFLNTLEVICIFQVLAYCIRNQIKKT